MRKIAIKKSRLIQINKICLKSRKFIFVDSEVDAFRNAAEIYHLMRFLSPLRQDRYSDCDRSQVKNDKRIEANLFKSAIACARARHLINAGYFLGYQLSPYIDLFTEKCEAMAYVGIDRWRHDDTKDELRLRALVCDLRQQVSARELIKKIENFEDGPLQNALSVENYIRGLGIAFGTLTFVRLELGCHMPIEREGSIQGNVLKSVKSAFKNVLKMVSNMESKIGYIWKLNFVRESSFRVQLFLIFEGIETSKMIQSANQIGHQWKNEGELRNAAFLNCNELLNDPVKTLSLGWGTSLRDHKENEDEVLLFFKSMFRRDRYLKLKIDGFRKTFSKGNLKA